MRTTVILIILSTLLALFGCGQPDPPERAPAIPDGLWVQPGTGAAPKIAFLRDDKYGYLDAKGRVAIPPVYGWADDFRGGYALCRLNGQFTIIDESGSVVGKIPEAAGGILRADVDRIWYEVDSKWGLCNLQGDVLVQPMYDDVHAFSDALARVNLGAELEFPGFMEGGKTGYINRDGEPVIPCRFEEESCWDFHNGYARVGDKLIDKQGEVQFTRSGYGRIFADGLISLTLYKENPATDYVDAKGKIQFTVEGAGEEFSEGLAVVSRHRLAGFIDKSGTYVIPPRYEDAESFSNGLAGVAVGKGRWGYANRQGELVTPAHFNEVRPAAKEFAIVHYGGTKQTALDAPVWWEGGRWLMIDRSGRPLAVIRKDKQ